jgi:hypothetical protein
MKNVFYKVSQEMAVSYFDALSRKHKEVSLDSGYPSRLEQEREKHLINDAVNC